MGADCHARVMVHEYKWEKRDGNDVSDKVYKDWKPILVPNVVSPWRWSHEDDPDNLYADNDGNPYIQLYDGRDYELFGILAGVRSDIYEQIDDVRGVPDFAPDEVKAWMRDEGFHSQTYYYLSELRHWLDRKSHFKYVDDEYMDELSLAEQKSLRKEYKSMRKRFEYFVWSVEATAHLAGYYNPDEIVVCLTFDS